MIIKIEYDKTTNALNLTKDEEIVAVINNDTVVDDSDTLSFEIALDVSQYQEQFNEFMIHGDNNE
jgi:hypothetical protein